MFLELHDRKRRSFVWAAPGLIVIISAITVWSLHLSGLSRSAFLRQYGVVPRALTQMSDPNWQLSDAALRLVSSIFVHVDLLHMVGNLIFLTVFGIAVERVIRGRLTLLLFFSCGLLANLIAAIALRESNAPIVGSSGAVSGLIGAYLYLFPRAKLGVVLPLGLYFQLVRVPAQHLIGLWFLLQVMYTLSAPGLSTVAWWAHVIGFINGFLLAIVLSPILRRRAREYLLNT